MPERIVIASDGGVGSRAAMDWVVDRARRVELDIEVVTVEELTWLPVGADSSHYRHQYRTELQAASAFLSRHPGVRSVATRLLAGDPAHEIARAGARADLLVIGSPRKSSDGGALHGTLALKIAARGTTRLAVIPSDWEPGQGDVVVGIDEDDSSDEAIEAAASEAVASAGKLVLVHAWTLPVPFSGLDALLGTTYPTLEAIHQRILDDAGDRARAHAPQLAIEKVLSFGKPAPLLATTASTRALLVVGCHGANRLEQLFLGSVGHDVLLAATAPVLVVPMRRAATAGDQTPD